MSDFADRLSRLAPEQRARFMQQIRGGADRQQPQAALTRRDHGPLTRPSFQQEQMWFVDKLGGGRARNNIALSVQLLGPVDQAALTRAVTTVVRRHDVLHSRLVEVDGRPMQERLPGYLPEIEQRDLSGEAVPADALEREAAAVAAAPFDLAAGPPLRLRLYRLGAEHHVLLWVVHHVAWDPGSTAILVDELTGAYEAFVAGREAELPELAVRYADVAAWQRERLTPEQTERLSEFWVEALGGAAASEVMPDHPRVSELAGEGKGRSHELGQAVLDRLRALAAEEDTTLFVVLLAAFNALLARWTRSDDVVVGTAAARRPHADTRGLIGCFVDMIVLRTPVDAGSTFRELVVRTRQTVLDAFAHGHLPFEQVVEAVRPPRDALRHPLFQIEFTSLGSWGTHEREAGGVRFAVEQLHDSAAKFDLSMLAGEVADHLELSLEFNTSLYRDETGAALLHSFGHVLTHVAGDPDAPVAGLRLVDPAEESRLTGPLSHGAPANEEARSRSLVDLFRAQAARTPAAPAVRASGARVDYATLDAWSDAVARQCSDRGVAPGDGVALRTDRGPAAVAAVLGILKAGAYYVPVDPTAPQARVRAVIADAETRLLLSDAPARDADLGVGVLEIAGGPPQPGTTAGGPPQPGSTATSPDVPVTAGSLAYVLYTSGSSGSPKGVMVEHGSVSHFATEIARAYDIDARDRLLQYAPLTFDVSVFELFTALVTGAELVVAEGADRLDPPLLARLMREAQVTVAELPPALMPLLDPGALGDLRLVSVGGEAFPGALVADWTAGGRRFVNGYGPTETTVAVTLYDCAGEWDRNPPIGRPMAGHQALVLDEALRAVPAGAPGELCIAGPGVARGYRNRPDLTAERFVHNPYAVPGADRLYRTGDLVRWLPDGNLEFLGRTDRQVKLHGFRIEPGEVESVLAAHPGVAQAAVAVVPGSGGERVLAGYVVATTGSALDAGDVREHAAQHLPGYMVPVVVVLDSLPLTASGKVDHRALPPPAQEEAGAEAAGASARDEIEEYLLTEVVAPMLERPSLDVEADFFAAGGSSLQATTVVARVREHFDVEIALADFFKAPTVAHLAELVRAAQHDAAAEEERMLAIFEQVEQMTDEEAAELLQSLHGNGHVDARR